MHTFNICTNNTHLSHRSICEEKESKGRITWWYHVLSFTFWVSDDEKCTIVIIWISIISLHNSITLYWPLQNNSSWYFMFNVKVVSSQSVFALIHRPSIEKEAHAQACRNQHKEWRNSRSKIKKFIMHSPWLFKPKIYLPSFFFLKCRKDHTL